MPKHDWNYGSSELKQAYPLGQEPPSVLRQWALEERECAHEIRPRLPLTDYLVALAGVSLLANGARKSGGLSRLLLAFFTVRFLHRRGISLWPRIFRTAR